MFHRPSLTGGFFVNSEANEDLVLAQFYFLLALYALPLALVLGWEDDITIVSKVTYSAIVGVVFLIIQLLNTKLHRVLDLENAKDDIGENSSSAEAISGATNEIDNGLIGGGRQGPSDVHNRESCQENEMSSTAWADETGPAYTNELIGICAFVDLMYRSVDYRSQFSYLFPDPSVKQKKN